MSGSFDHKGMSGSFECLGTLSQGTLKVMVGFWESTIFLSLRVFEMIDSFECKLTDYHENSQILWVFTKNSRFVKCSLGAVTNVKRWGLGQPPAPYNHLGQTHAISREITYYQLVPLSWENRNGRTKILLCYCKYSILLWRLKTVVCKQRKYQYI